MHLLTCLLKSVIDVDMFFDMSMFYFALFDGVVINDFVDLKGKVSFYGIKTNIINRIKLVVV